MTFINLIFTYFTSYNQTKPNGRPNKADFSPAVNPLPPSDAVWKQKKKYFREFFQFSIVTIQKISPLWKPKI